jgi:hypothetical protein
MVSNTPASPRAIPFPIGDLINLVLGRLFKIAHTTKHFAGQRRWSILNRRVLHSNKIITFTSLFFTEAKPLELRSALGQIKFLRRGDSSISPIQKEK